MEIKSECNGPVPIKETGIMMTKTCLETMQLYVSTNTAHKLFCEGDVMTSS